MSASWEAFAKLQHGRSRLSSAIADIDHPAKAMLLDMRNNGVPVNLAPGSQPSSKTIEEQVTRGPHRSATSNSAFVRDEFANFADSGFFAILPYSVAKTLPNFRPSPTGSIPQHDRRDRLIGDHTFWGINQATIPYAPPEAMQFGHAFTRLLYQIRHANPAFGPVYTMKGDVSDGFYRDWLDPTSAPALALLIPGPNGEPEADPLCAIPHVSTMGWAQSPPAFCVLTETIADLANARMYRRWAPPHRLEAIAEEGPNSSYELCSQIPELVSGITPGMPSPPVF